MLKREGIDKLCAAVMALAVVLTLIFMNGKTVGPTPAFSTPGYETRLFDKSRFHTIDILIDDWQAFLDTALEEQYSTCTIMIVRE